MKNYGLKVNSPYNVNKYEERVMYTAGSVVLFESGVYKIMCDGDTYISHNLTNGLMHITCESNRDDININIKASGLIDDDNVCDVYHKVISKNQNVTMNINVKGVASDSSKIIYRSQIGGTQNSSGNGLQKADFIMLSNNSEVDAEPNLNLESNIIPTKHSVSISGLKKENIFYMNIHGLGDGESERELIEGFLC
jgi:Fe-S cluster assembly protein SufD